LTTKFVSAWTEKNKTYLVERINEDTVKIRAVPARFSFFVTGLDEYDRMALGRDPGVIGVIDQGRYTRVNCRNHWTRKELVEVLEEAIVRNESGAKILEADVSPLRRLLSDVPNLEIDPEPNVVFLDLETDSRATFSEATRGEARLLSFAVCDAAGRASSGLLAADTDEAERSLWGEFFDVLRGYDCVLAWYGSGFDFLVIQNRSVRLGVTLNGREIQWHRWTWLDHLELFMKYNKLGTGEEKTSYALDHVAQYLLGEGKGKLAFDSSKTWEAWAAGGEERERLLRYNEQDAALLPRIEEKTGFLALHLAVCQICRVFPDTESLNATIQGDGFLLRLGEEHGIRWPTKKPVDDEAVYEKFKGAYVMEPGRYGAIPTVHVADFAGLYPSIMRTWNMSLETKVNLRGVYDDIPEDVELEPRVKSGLCQLPNRATWFKTTEEGMFKIALDRLVYKRAEYTALMKKETPGSKQHEKFKRLSQAFKTVANSFYGIVGSPFSRFFDVEIAEGVTQTGKWLLQNVIRESQAVGFDPFYGDTDSVFVAGCTPEEFRALVDALNESWSKRLEPWGIGSHFIDLDFEKTFSRIIMITAKRYVGKFLMYKGKAAPDDAPPEVKGLEFNRGDSIRLARDFQRQVIDRLLERDLPSAADMRDLVLDWKNRVYRGELSLEDVVMSQSLSKSLREYSVQSAPPHVRVARLMVERGEQIGEGARVRFLVIPGDGSKLNPIPASDPGALERIDRIYYWGRKVYPPVQRVLEKVYPKEQWAETTKEKRSREFEAKGQGTLFDTIGSHSTVTPRRRKKRRVDGLEITIVEGSPFTDGGAEKVRRERLLKAIHTAIDANPGEVPVTVVVAFKSYTEGKEETVKVYIDTKTTIADTPASRAALMRILSKPDRFEFLS
jgi:DNA polymerase elongation subunit (family B)